MLHNFTITGNEISNTFTSRSEPRIRIIVNNRNRRTVILTEGRRKLYDRMGLNKIFSEELDRMFRRAQGMLG